MSHAEFLEMANAINEAGGGFFDGNFSQLIEKFDQNNDGNVDFGEFLMVDTFFPMAFYPVFRMQDALQIKTLGVDIWLKLISRYDEGERRRCAERDVRRPFVPPRPFVARMVALGAMTHIAEDGGLAKLKGASASASSSSSSSSSSPAPGVAATTAGGYGSRAGSSSGASSNGSPSRPNSAATSGLQSARSSQSETGSAYSRSGSSPDGGGRFGGGGGGAGAEGGLLSSAGAASTPPS